MKALKKGIFITFEGPEGCGKSTQSYKLAEALKNKGYDLIATREPGGTSVGQRIREILLDPENSMMVRRAEILLFAADRVQHLEEKILPALAQRKIVICDRYVDSTIAYQIGGRELAEDMITQINRLSTEGKMPDLTFLIDIPIEEGLQRATKQGSDRFEKEFTKFHEKVRKKYLEIAQQDKDRIIVLDGLDKIDVLHAKIIEIVTSRIASEQK